MQFSLSQKKVAFKLRISWIHENIYDLKEKEKKKKHLNQWKKRIKEEDEEKKLQQRIRYCCLVYILTVWVNCRFGNLSFTTTFEQQRNCNFLLLLFCCKMNINAFHSFVHIPFIHWKKSNICFVFAFCTLWLMKHTYMWMLETLWCLVSFNEKILLLFANFFIHNFLRFVSEMENQGESMWPHPHPHKYQSLHELQNQLFKLEIP